MAVIKVPVDARVDDMVRAVTKQFGSCDLRGNIQHLQWGLRTFAQSEGMLMGIWDGNERMDEKKGLVFGVILIGEG